MATFTGLTFGGTAWTPKFAQEIDKDKCAELYSAMKIRGFLHLYNGEEAIAVGVMQSLKPNLGSSNLGV